MFFDEVSVTFAAGNGGNGAISWRREKYIPKGGPFGGNGGRGGNIVLHTTQHETTLVRFRHARTIKASDGERGGDKEMNGASGEDTIVQVPIGTVLTDVDTGEIIVDMCMPGQVHTLCEGGRGGFGNSHFKGSTRQAPNFAELGDTGYSIDVKMELKLVADIGIIGLPNAGKSTLIQSLTNVKPKIANYPFTTIIPNLGVLEYKGKSIVIEDAPGLIEGASSGKGLGIQFLKHIERTMCIIHLIDATAEPEDIVHGYQVIRTELGLWSADMAAKEEMIILSKIDILSTEDIAEKKAYFEKETGKKVLFSISAGAYIHIDELKNYLVEKIDDPILSRGTYIAPAVTEDIESGMQNAGEKIPNYTKIYDLKAKNDPRKFKLSRESDGMFVVAGDRIEEIVRMTDMRYEDGVNRVYDIMEKVGIIRKIKTILTTEMLANKTGWFEGDEDLAVPHVRIAGKDFSLKGILFMKGE